MVTQVFFYYIGLCIWVGLGYFFSQHIGNLYFCDFGLYLDSIEVYLDFNHNYNLVFLRR